MTFFLSHLALAEPLFFCLCVFQSFRHYRRVYKRWHANLEQRAWLF